jgi:hypothetical protein
MTRGLGRFLRHNAIALLALFLALGGTSFAAATLINGKLIKPHTIAKNRLTNKAIAQLRGNRGPQGPAGAAGARGPTGAQGPGAQWALVQPDGTITRQSGGIIVSHVQTGGFIVTFPSDVSHELSVATSALSNDGSFRGMVIADSCADYSTFCNAYGASLTNGVAVFTTDTTNSTQEDHAFFIAAVGPNSTSSAASHTRMGALGR